MMKSEDGDAATLMTTEDNAGRLKKMPATLMKTEEDAAGNLDED
jgi:hypothetical protein